MNDDDLLLNRDLRHYVRNKYENNVIRWYNIYYERHYNNL